MEQYRWLTKALHWLTVALLTAQFVLGYAMEPLSEALFESDSAGRGGDRIRAGDDQLVFVHAGLGLAILLVAVVRLAWRRWGGLPEWSERLSGRERALEAWLERLLYATLFVIPVSGWALLYASGEERELANREEWLPPWDAVSDDLMVALHVAGHLIFFVALAVHVGLAVRRRTLSRMW